MADTLQHGSISGSASVRQRVSGEIVIGGKIMKELRFLPYSEFPEIGREETLYIDTDNNAMYYYDGSAYVALSGGGGGGTDNYNALTNKPSVNSVTLIGDKTSSELGLQELISDLSTIRSGAALGTTAVQPEALEMALSDKQDVINDLDDIRAGAELGETAVQPADMEVALADKQDTISDLATIRSGAASGATAVQPSDMEEALSEKQDVISDLSTIRSGATSGATAVQPDDMETALSGKQDTISDLQTIRSGAALGATAVQPSDMETALADKQDVIADLNDIRTGAGLGATAVQPSDMETALANKQDVISDLDAIRSGATAGATALQPEDVDTLPTDGSSNPVSSGGTYNFVNSSIATNTAYFIGTFASVEELEAYTGTVTNNDYAFVTSTDSAGNTLYNRYKYNAATQTWSFEYAVNNTAFTAAQWAAIQSGLTASDRTKLDGIETGANKTVIDASPTSGSSNAVSSGGVHTALSGKQDIISDLSDIRSGASAGATAVQPSALNDALGTLDVSSVGGSGKYISAISETNGKISATETTMDTTPTANSTVPVTSGGVAASQAAQQSEINYAVNTGAKNILTPTLTSESTKEGITCTPNPDGTFTLNGTFPTTSSNTSVYFVVVNNAKLKELSNKYGAINVICSGGSDIEHSQGRLRFYKIDINEGTYDSSATDKERSLTLSDNIMDSSANISIVVYRGQTLNNVVIRPMIRPVSISDTTYQPYAKTNRELTVAEDEDRAALIGQVDKGAKNLLRNTASSQVVGGVTFTVNADGTIIANGTKTNNDWLYLSTGNSLAAGTYVLSSGLAPQSNSSIRLIITTADSLGSAIMGTEGEQQVNIKQLTSDYTGLYYAIRISSGTTVNNVVFKPMLCTASDWTVSQKFVPYALSNSILTPALIEQVDDGAKNIFKVGVSSYTYASAVTCTVATDGKITVNGTNPNTSNGILYQDLVTAKTTWKNTRYTLPAGKYGCKGSGVTGLSIQVYCHDGTNAKEIFNSRDDGVFEYTEEQKAEKPYIAWRLSISASAAISNATVQPMICTAADWAVSQKFVPYAPTNRELYETKAEKTEIHDLLANIDSNTTITAYADSLVKGHYTSFIANTSCPTDVPVFDNMFIEIYVYSSNTILIRAFPTSTVNVNQFFQKSKIAGVWRDWNKFEGTAVT